MKKLFLYIFLVTILSSTVHALPQCKGENKFKLSKPFKWHKCNGNEKIGDDTYEGEYRFGEFDGDGTYFFASGEKYIGKWKKGNQNGFGIYINSKNKTSSVIYNKGKLIKQTFKIDIEDGKHIYEYTNGYKYDGNFVNGFKHGEGTLISGDNNEKFVGEFKNGFKHGEGKLALYKFGNHLPYLFYDGEWKYDQKNGQGEEEYADGSKHKGSFINNKIEQEGIFILANGGKCYGFWKDGIVSLSRSDSQKEKNNYKKIENLEKDSKKLITNKNKSKEEKEKIKEEIKKEIDKLKSEIPILSDYCNEFIKKTSF